MSAEDTGCFAAFIQTAVKTTNFERKRSRNSPAKLEKFDG